MSSSASEGWLNVSSRGAWRASAGPRKVRARRGNPGYHRAQASRAGFGIANVIFEGSLKRPSRASALPRIESSWTPMSDWPHRWL